MSIAAMVFTTLFSTGGSGAAAQSYEPKGSDTAARAEKQAPSIPPVLIEDAAGTQVVVRAGPIAVSPDGGDGTATPLVDVVPEPRTAASLTALVERTALPDDLSSELNCLAGAVYFEAKGESLAGQLAVGRVIVARTRSGRFPTSYCGVVYQPSQFSFVHGGTMPVISRNSRAWGNAVRIARIAHEGSWKSPVEGALFFHAARVAPMNRTRIAQIDHQVFYR
ncbi:cell wall hydrolase [Novosphingobium sp.]|uniref:cell wall hydrolase n=1 Tax=Novosphingobium sp. TaxID=1874826 RepID=UPI0034548AB6